MDQVWIEDLRDAEIEELGRPRLVDDDVARFDIAMDDLLLVSVVEGRAHLLKKFEAIFDSESFALGGFIKTQAIDQHHDEVGNTIPRRPAVKEPGA